MKGGKVKLGVGQVLGRSASKWGKNIVRFGALSVVVQLPLLALPLRALGKPPGSTDAPLWVGFAFAYTLSILAHAPIVYALAEQLRGSQAGFAGALRGVANRLAPLLILAVGWAALLTTLQFVMFHDALGESGGLLGLLIPVVATASFVSIPVVVVEKKGAIAALVRSATLIRSSAFRVFAIILVLLVVEAVAMTGVMTAVRFTVGHDPSPELLGVAISLVQIPLLAPLWAVTTVVVYDRLTGELDPSLRVRLEPRLADPVEKRWPRRLAALGIVLAALIIAGVLYPTKDSQKAPKTDVEQGLAPSAPGEASSSSSKLTMRELVRPPLSLEVPDWKITDDTSSPAVGAYHVEDRDRAVHVSWSSVESMSAAGFERWRGRFGRDGAHVVDSHESDGEKSLRFDALLTAPGKAADKPWVSRTKVLCHKTGVAVTIVVETRDRELTKALKALVMANFQCTGDSPEKFALKLPSSSVSSEFGYAKAEGQLILAHRDSRRLVVVPIAGDFSSAVRNRPKRVLEPLAALGLGSAEIVGRPRDAAGLGGAELVVLDAKAGPDFPVEVSAYYCREQHLSFAVLGIAGDAKRGKTLAELVEQFGCPGDGKPIDERRSACDAGIDWLCDGK